MDQAIFCVLKVFVIRLLAFPRSDLLSYSSEHTYLSKKQHEAGDGVFTCERLSDLPSEDSEGMIAKPENKSKKTSLALADKRGFCDG